MLRPQYEAIGSASLLTRTSEILKMKLGRLHFDEEIYETRGVPSLVDMCEDAAVHGAGYGRDALIQYLRLLSCGV